MKICFKARPKKQKRGPVRKASKGILKDIHLQREGGRNKQKWQNLGASGWVIRTAGSREMPNMMWEAGQEKGARGGTGMSPRAPRKDFVRWNWEWLICLCLQRGHTLHWLTYLDWNNNSRENETKWKKIYIINAKKKKKPQNPTEIKNKPTNKPEAQSEEGYLHQRPTRE